MAIITEYAPKGDLSSLVYNLNKYISWPLILRVRTTNNNHQTFTDEQSHELLSQLVQISLDVARALQYLHSQTPPIAHLGRRESSIELTDSPLDVKSQNVLLLSYNHNHSVAKLGDFGTAKVLHSLLTSKPLNFKKIILFQC